MANNYTFYDASASVQTAASSIVSGAHQQYIQISSILFALPTSPTGNQSVSGTVNIAGNPSISGTVNVGNLPANQSVSGTVGASVIGHAPVVIIGGSVATATTNSSVMLLAGANPIGSVTTLQGTNPWIITGSVQGSFSPAGNQSVSGTVGASVIGHAPVVIIGGSIATATTNSSVMLLTGTNMIGSVATYQGTVPWAVAGSVAAFQAGTAITSIVSSIPSSVLVGSHAQRNDAVASFLGGNLTWNPIATDSAGRILMRPFAPEEARVEGYNSVVSTSVTTLVPAAGTGLRNYITDVFIANTGASATLVTFRSGGGTSVLGYTIAPAGSGSNLPGLMTPIRTLANETFDIQATTATSILFATVKGYKAP